MTLLMVLVCHFGAWQLQFPFSFLLWKRAKIFFKIFHVPQKKESHTGLVWNNIRVSTVHDDRMCSFIISKWSIVFKRALTCTNTFPLSFCFLIYISRHKALSYLVNHINTQMWLSASLSYKHHTGLLMLIGTLLFRYLWSLNYPLLFVVLLRLCCVFYHKETESSWVTASLWEWQNPLFTAVLLNSVYLAKTTRV